MCYVNEHSVMTSTITLSAPHMALTLILSITLQIIDFFLPVVYAQVFIWSYIKKRLKLHVMANHQGNRELLPVHYLTVLLFYFRSSEEILLLQK